MPRTKAAAVALTSKSAEDLTRQYFDTIRKLQADVQKRVEGAARELYSVPPELQNKSRREAVDVINTYVEAVKAAIGQPDAVLRHEQALRAYVLGLQRVSEQAQKELIDSLQEYATALREIPSELREGLQVAYSEYIDGLKEALAQVDFESVEPETLTSVAQSMLTVGLLSRAALGK
jgi:hypothetical protein